MPLPTTERVEELLRDVDVALLQSSWTAAVELGDQVPTHFYSVLFLLDAGLGEMFPPSMAQQRHAVMRAIGNAVASVDSAENLTRLEPILARLGTDHRKYGVEADHYPLVGAALLATLEHFFGESFAGTLRTSWTSAYQIIAEIMQAAAADAAAAGTPPWWDSVIDHLGEVDEDVITMTLKTNQPYALGDAKRLTLCHLAHPGMWRTAKATQDADDELLVAVTIREDDPATMELAYGSAEGNYVRVGPPLTLNAHSTEEDQ